jgi:hypothetical protein
MGWHRAKLLSIAGVVIDYLISFLEFDFSSYQAVLDGLLELDIFTSSTDVRYDDFVSAESTAV